MNALMRRAWDDLAELVAFRSVADAKQFPPEECTLAAQWVVDAFTELGLEDVEMSETPDGSMAVHGHAPAPDGAPTVLLYSHYDVQPPLGEDKWKTPVWQLTERDGRWYGRGSADCKGNIALHLTALRALKERYRDGMEDRLRCVEGVGTPRAGCGESSALRIVALGAGPQSTRGAPMPDGIRWVGLDVHARESTFADL